MDSLRQEQWFCKGLTSQTLTNTVDHAKSPDTEKSITENIRYILIAINCYRQFIIIELTNEIIDCVTGAFGDF